MALALIQWLSRGFKDPGSLCFALPSSPQWPGLSRFLSDLRMKVAQSFTHLPGQAWRAKEMTPVPHPPALFVTSHWPTSKPIPGKGISLDQSGFTPGLGLELLP